jgi:hypothetical protein
VSLLDGPASIPCTLKCPTTWHCAVICGAKSIPVSKVPLPPTFYRGGNREVISSQPIFLPRCQDSGNA